MEKIFDKDCNPDRGNDTAQARAITIKAPIGQVRAYVRNDLPESGGFEI